MTPIIILVSCFCVLAAAARDNLTFPDDFEFGTSTSAYQIEGAWDIDGKGMSIWDHLVRTRPQTIIGGTNGDVAADSYHLYKRDVEILKELGVQNYRFSISWPRILPYGRPDYVNPKGIAYYNSLIDELLANNIVPFVTIYHWDLPQNLNEQGGWLNEEIVNWYGEYARVVFQHFGDRVKHWMTINEAHVFCSFGYGYAVHAPMVYSPGEGYYECGRHVLLANARAYHIYDEEFRASQGGQVGFVISMEWSIAASDSPDDQQAVVDHAAFHIHHFLDPIFSPHGDYPEALVSRVAAASAQQGLNASRLRPFTEQQIEYMRGTADFLGLNHYSTRMVYRNASLAGQFVVPSFDDDQYVGTYEPPDWPRHGFNTEYAEGFYKLLMYLTENYSNTTIYVTENGCASDEGRDDRLRVEYFRNYLSALLRALNEGANIKGYFAWSLMDNFEWTFGYTMRFGLYEVDMDDPNRRRSPKKSALVYKEIIRNRTIDYSFDPDPFSVGNRAYTSIWSLIFSVFMILATIILS